MSENPAVPTESDVAELMAKLNQFRATLTEDQKRLLEALTVLAPDVEGFQMQQDQYEKEYHPVVYVVGAFTQLLLSGSGPLAPK